MKKLLYVSANPEVLPSLKPDAEISAIQERLLVEPDNGLKIIALPDVDVLRLESVLQQEKPDILHIAAHGENDALMTRASSAGGRKPLTAAMLNGWLPDPAPQLVYVNACKSDQFVKSLVNLGQVSLAIGTDAGIENSTARAAAVTFYSRIISGSTIQEAFNACSSMASFHQSSVRMVLEDPKHQAGQLILRRAPLLVARFVDYPMHPREKGRYAFQLGIFSCPRQTSQVIFFTDDEGYARRRPEEMERNMSTIVRGNPTEDEEYWVPVKDKLNWYASREARIFVAGVSPDGSIFSIRATNLSVAVERYYMMTNGGIVPAGVHSALKDLLSPERIDRMFNQGILRQETEVLEEQRGRAPRSTLPSTNTTIITAHPGGVAAGRDNFIVGPSTFRRSRQQ